MSFLSINLTRKNIFDLVVDGFSFATAISGSLMMYFAKALAKAIRFGVGGALAGL
jgi:hypothetical protein